VIGAMGEGIAVDDEEGRRGPKARGWHGGLMIGNSRN
jgi:hypothetical protein